MWQRTYVDIVGVDVGVNFWVWVSLAGEQVDARVLVDKDVAVAVLDLELVVS